MQTATKRLQKLVSYVVSTALAMQAVAVLMPSSFVRAATGDLIINEINWAGSTGNASDEWFELYNNSGSTINFSATPYTLQLKDASDTLLDTITLGAGVPSIPNMGYLVVHNNPAGSTLDAGSLVAAYEPATDFNLPNLATSYILLDNASAEVDAVKPAAPGDAIPFAGSAGTSVSSMRRISASVPGSTLSNWASASTIGANFLPSVEQYGTPGLANVEIAVPSNNALSPFGSVMLPATVGISGNVDGVTTSVVVTTARMGTVPSSTTQVLSPAAGVYTGNLSLLAGRYLISVQAIDVVGNLSKVRNVAANASGNEFNYVVLAASSAVASPVLNAFPAITNIASPVLSGSAVDAIEVDVLVNGEYFQTVTTIGGMFSLPVSLNPNMSNVVSFVSVNALGDVSVPTMATIVHDNIAPLVVDTTKVVLTSNAPGVSDTLVGLVGAAEAGSALSLYKDAAATMQIGATVMVNANGSFNLIDLGDNLVGTVYMRLQDAAGNVSGISMVQNVISFVPAAGITVVPGQVLETQAKFTWNVIPGAVNYLVKYRTTEGTFTAAMKLCSASATSCIPDLTLINLTAGTRYILAIAAVDSFGNATPYSEYVFTTNTPVATVAAENTPVEIIPAVAAPVKKLTTRVQPSPTPVPTAAATPTPEAGEVKSSTEEVARNLTPWIVLGILITIAALATLGYFYWFGGAAGEVALAATESAKAKKDAAAGSSASKKSEGKEKRW